MSRYAAQTSVSSDKTQAEIEKTLRRYGADEFARGWNADSVVLGFVAHGRQIRFTLPMPHRDDDEFRLTPSRKWEREPRAQEAAYEQAVRQRWRALLLILKAKLEAVESGIVSFESEFLSCTVLPSGQTVTDWLDPQIERAYQTQEMPELLPSTRPAIGGDR